MTVTGESLASVIEDVYTKLKRKRKREDDEDDYYLDEFGCDNLFVDEDEYYLDVFEIDNFFPHYIIPPELINTEDIRQTLLDISDYSFCTEIWLTYCKDLALEDTLRGLEHDHCYSNTSQYNGLVGLPKSSVNNTVITSNTITKSSPSLYLMGSEDGTEYNNMDCDTFNQTSSSHTIESSDVTESNVMDCDTFNQTPSSYAIESSDVTESNIMDCDTLKQTSSSCRTKSTCMTESDIIYAHTLYQTSLLSAIDTTDVTESYIMDFDAVNQITDILEELIYGLCYRLPYDIRTVPHFARYLIKSSDGTGSYDLDYDKFFKESFSDENTTQQLLDLLLNATNTKVDKYKSTNTSSTNTSSTNTNASHVDSGCTPIEYLCDSPSKLLNSEYQMKEESEELFLDPIAIFSSH